MSIYVEERDNPSTILSLPDELLEAVVSNLSPAATLAFGSTCKRCNKIVYEPLVWRRHCVQTWKYWETRYEIAEKLELPPVQTKWRQLYNERRRTDREALELFDSMLLTQENRYQSIEEIAKYGYDVKELLIQLRDKTPDDAEYALARRYYSNAILGQIHRTTALEKWTRLQKRQMVKLEEVLGAYDLFVLAGEKGDLQDIELEFDRIAQCVRDRTEEFDELSTRRKAVEIARYLRDQNLVGNPSEDDYHALRNNFISIALFDDIHTSLPLQSVAIYCSVARRLGVNAKPSNYPQHVHAVIEAPSDKTLDGRDKTPLADADPEIMHMDPWRTSEEIPTDRLRLRLAQMGAPATQHAYHLGATSNLEVALRTGRNIMNSIQEARDRQHAVNQYPNFPDIEAAWYAMLWSMLILGDSNQASTLHRRRQCLPYLIEHFQAHFPEDLGLIETYIPPMFEGQQEHHILMHLITTARTSDRNKRAPHPRGATTQAVKYKVGYHFRHRRYNYTGFLAGWDVRCNAAPQWIEQMRINDLKRGSEQPFYNVV